MRDPSTWYAGGVREPLLVTIVALLLACGPVARLPGGRLFGPVVREPVADWSFTDAYATIAVEVRPSFPHSVTTWCFEHGGDLYIPAGRPGSKLWPELVRQNPSLRLEIDGRIYAGRALRVTDPVARRELLASLAAKYDLPLASLGSEDPLPDVAFFRFVHEAG